MKKTTYMYHGTSMESAVKLARNGWDWKKDAPDSNWICSERNQVYAWCGLSFALQEDRIESVEEYEPGLGHDADAIRYAFESAQIAAAVQNSKENNLVVFGWKVEYDDHDSDEDIAECLEGYWTEDLSCENMSGAFCIYESILKDAKPDVVYFCRGYDPMVRPFLIPIKNEYFNISILDDFERQVVKTCQEGDRDFSIGEEILSWVSDISQYTEATVDDIPTWRY